ncbi:tRNA (cytidine(34)-2'-O)-methyltransferase [Alphaproteobacteria bacterium]|nr:tRNA (cytidine(34)-2'-O)-methyltransferase [Alphaproteobacteria bacterium]
MRIALYQPDIPQNAGAIIRLSACLGVGLDIIEPVGFVMNDAKLRRVGMDYLENADVSRRRSWEDFQKNRDKGRLVLLSTKGSLRCYDFAFEPSDCLILGRESKGAPEFVHEAADATIRIPMRPSARSLNLAVAAAIVVAEALRQTGGLPDDQPWV